MGKGATEALYATHRGWRPTVNLNVECGILRLLSPRDDVFGVLWSLSEHVRRRPCNPEGCQTVAGGRSASADPRKRARKSLHPGGVPESKDTSAKSNEPFKDRAASRFSTGLFQRIE